MCRSSGSVYAKPLTGSRYSHLYNIRRNASTMTSSATSWMQANITTLLPISSAPIRILSVGAGCGDVDIPFLSSLLSHNFKSKANVAVAADSPPSIHYKALEPIEEDRSILAARLEQLKASLPVPNQSHLTLSTDCTFFEDFVTGDEYDLIIFSQVMYYFSHPLRIISIATKLLSGHGRLLIVHNTPIGVPEIQKLLMQGVKGDYEASLSSDGIEQALRQINASYTSTIVDAELKIPSDTEAALDIMSFCLECDLATLAPTDPRVKRVREEFTGRCSADGVLQEPIAMFHVKAAIQRKCHVEDTDPVSDYRELAHSLDWESLSQSLGQHQSLQPTRVLDVGCGTGRWLKAFSMYTQFENEILIDAVDPDAESLRMYMTDMPPPFSTGTAFATVAQEANLLPRDTYDIVWSVHSMYGVPRRDLQGVIKGVADALVPSHGVALFVMPTSDSSYVSIHTNYMHGQQKRNENSHDKQPSLVSSATSEAFTQLTCYEDIIKAVRSMGLPHRVRTVFYEETISEQNKKALTQYVVNESMSNCFSRDDEKTLDNNFLNGNPTFSDVMRMPEFAKYINSFRRGKLFCFPQEVKIITFGRQLSALEDLPASFGPISAV